MATFFHGGSEAREASASAFDLTLQQQHSLLLMNPLGHALLHAPPSLTAVDASTCAPDDHHHHHYSCSNLCFGSPVDPIPNPIRDVIDPGPSGSHGLELLPRPPLAVVSPRSCNKLSLTLSSQQTQTRTQTQTQTQTRMQAMYMTSDNNTTTDHVEQGNSPVSTVSNGVVFGTAPNCFDPKYLKAAQELLDEVVSVGNAKKSDCDGSKGKLSVKREFSGDGGRKPSVGELSPAYRQELQMKKAKLVSMVEEVEHRYRHYHDQMQAIVSSFEQAAGYGAARSYTSLALQTISKQFRCLKDAIGSQIKLIAKCLGEECGRSSSSILGSKGEGFRSLRLLDQTQLRHLGIMPQHHPPNAWRPQRGLPERAVSVLRAWLFENFLHPYPKDLDKQMLAKQTGLTRSQVSNWFINARVRLWKPMVEEMYLEEVKGHENTQDDNINEETKDLELQGSSSKHPSSDTLDPLPEKPNLYDDNNNVSDQCSSSIVSASYLAAASHHGGIFSPLKKLRTFENDVVVQTCSSNVVSFDVERKQQHDHEAREAAHLIHFNGGLGDYHPHHHHTVYGNGVSLSLGLPHSCDQTFNSIQFGTSHQIEFSGVSPSSTYQNMDNIPDKKRFVA